MAINEIESHIFVIFGATGNLTRRKLLPALFRLSSKKELKSKGVILGVARSDLNDESFRNLTSDILKSTEISVEEDLFSSWCESCLYYQSIDQGSKEDYIKLATRIQNLESENQLPSNRVFNMALPPRIFPQAIIGLGEAGLNHSDGWTRIVLEKPFGQDFNSAQKLNDSVHKYFDENQIYRIDHFLGKETVQNLLVFRFANTFFEHLWSREHIDSVEITVAENVGIERRSNYYEQTGALRDMVQNHLTQLLTLVSMEAPTSFNASSIRNEKVKVLRQIVPIKPSDVVFGQYIHGDVEGKKVVGYREEPGVSSISERETFIALKLEIANSRWKGVPFYLRTSKRLPKRLTQIVLRYHYASVSIFQQLESESILKPNILILTLQPNEGFDIQFQVKAIGQPIKLTTQQLHFKYSEAFGPIPDAYERLLLDVITGDQTLFVRYDEVEEAWKLYNYLLEKDILVYPYPAGTWGPPKSNQLISDNKRHWFNPSE